MTPMIPTVVDIPLVTGWEISVGVLPLGIVIDALTGIIAGIPRVIEQQEVVVKASYGLSDYEEFSMTIDVSDKPTSGGAQFNG